MLILTPVCVDFKLLTLYQHHHSVDLKYDVKSMMIVLILTSIQKKNENYIDAAIF